MRNAGSRGNECAHYKPSTSKRCNIVSSSLHCFGRLFLYTCNRRSAGDGFSSCFPVPLSIRVRRFSCCRTTPRRIYSAYGGRYVLWLIVLLSLTYFQFTAAARRFASWLSIVCDERRFMCQPECPGPRQYSRSCLIPGILVASSTLSGISS